MPEEYPDVDLSSVEAPAAIEEAPAPPEQPALYEYQARGKTIKEAAQDGASQP